MISRSSKSKANSPVIRRERYGCFMPVRLANSDPLILRRPSRARISSAVRSRNCPGLTGGG